MSNIEGVSAYFLCKYESGKVVLCKMNTNYCPICGSIQILSKNVLWQELINEWQLSVEEVDYINRQQGLSCQKCGNNLRSIALASAIMKTYFYSGTFIDFCIFNPELKVLEINKAGNLTQFLQKITEHRLIEYPQFDMTNLAIKSEEFDLIIHSDTLEHVIYPERALSECRRVLRTGGYCIFTVPIIIDRMSRRRDGLVPSYHGQSGVLESDQMVYTEFGADFWKSVLKAGFISCEIYSFEYPSALAIIAKK